MTIDQVESIIATSAFPFPAKEAQLVETHISWIILTPEYVYKLKKPIQYSFLDFSTAARRHFFAGEELRLNRRLTSDMYLDVLPVRQTPEGPAIGKGKGEIIDWAVLMRRMDENRQMDRLLREKRVGRLEIWKIARQVAAFHRRCIPAPGVDGPREFEDKFEDLLSIREVLKPVIGKLNFTLLEKTVAKAPAFLKSHGDRLRRRGQLGWAVEGHGDLHSKNIFLLDKPVIFDCIEFNESFRRLDLLNEIAFFCMDLDYYGQERLANVFLSDYLNRLPCLETEEDNRLFHFFKLYRANVRLKVNCLRLRQPESEQMEARTRKAVEDYFQLFRRYAQQWH